MCNDLVEVHTIGKSNKLVVTFIIFGVKSTTINLQFN